MLNIKTLLFFSIVPFFGVSIHAQAKEAIASCVKINTIQINTLDVFEGKEKGNLIRRALDALHYVTRESIIRTELLFTEGDCYNLELVEETQRILRRMDVLSEAHVETLPVDEHSVDMRITTRDRFTLRAEVSGSRSGGESKGRISFGERNILGFNKAFFYSSSKKSNDETITQYAYEDSRFFNDYAINTVYEEQDNNVLEKYSLYKPYRSLSDKNSYGISYNKDGIAVEYNAGNSVEYDIPKKSESTSLAYSVELGSRYQSRRIQLGLASSRIQYQAIDELPDVTFSGRLKKTDLDIAYNWQSRDDFIAMERIDNPYLIQDIGLLTSFSLGGGLQWREENNKNKHHTKVSAQFAQVQLIHDSFLLSYQLRSDYRLYAGEIKESNFEAFTRGYYLLDYDKSIVLGASFNHQRLNDELYLPMTIGGEIGLRGYDNGTFSGNKRIITNIEFRDRFPSPSNEILLAHAVFIDTGYAWKTNQSITLGELRSNIGWGLRVQVPSLFGRTVLRLDLATPINHNELGLTITLGPIFRYNRSDN